jgi:arylsulfatase A-like enzyme
LITYLEINNLSENTVIIISADHGDDIYGRHGVTGHGLSLYNEEIKIPLVFYFPDKDPENISTPVSHIDVLPTVLDMLDLPQSDGFRGSPFTIQNRLFFYAQNHKYLIGMVRDNIKIIVDMNRMLTEVYDLEEDPLELEPLDKEQLHNEYIIELLNWHYCQLNYFSADERPEELGKTCMNF